MVKFKFVIILLSNTPIHCVQVGIRHHIKTPSAGSYIIRHDKTTIQAREYLKGNIAECRRVSLLALVGSIVATDTSRWSGLTGNSDI